MEHREHLLKVINPTSSKGLEIGPLTNPQILKSEGEVYYVDRASTEDIIEWYSQDPNVNRNNIVPIDFVWGKETLEECTRDKGPFDYVVACHVLEHIPDLIGWLKEIAAVLKTGGIAAFAIPDKHYTFDIKRRVTTIPEIAEAHLMGYRKPSPRQIIDHFSFQTQVNATDIWAGKVDPETLPPLYADPYFPVAAAERSINDDFYTDAHCTVATPRSFLHLLKWMSSIFWLDFSLEGFVETPHNRLEFYIFLKKLEDTPFLHLKKEAFEKSLEQVLPMGYLDQPE